MLRVLTLSTLFPDETRPTFGGFVARQTLNLAKSSGVEVRIVSPRGLPPAPFDRLARYRGRTALAEHGDWQGLPVWRPRFVALPGMSARFGPRALVAALLPGLRRLRRDWPFDVIDAEFFFPDGVAAVRLSAALGVPCSITARGSDIHYWGEGPARAQVLAAGRAAGGMLAVSAALKRDMVALGMPQERIAVHYTGVDLARFAIADRAAAKAALGVEGPAMLCLGNLLEAKGQWLAIDALAHLPGVTLLIAGGGPDEARLRARASAAGLGARVRFLGVQPHDRIPALLAAADAMVLPSANEGLANVWVEALACGTPVVTSDVGGAREVIDRPAAGRIVAREARAIADAVSALLADPAPREMTRAGALRFTWDANGAALEAHFRQVAARA